MQMGYTVSPPEQLISALAHQLTDEKQFDRAYYFLNMNIKNSKKLEDDEIVKNDLNNKKPSFNHSRNSISPV